MSLFDTLFPRQSRNPGHRSQELRQGRSRFPSRRNRLHELGNAEQLERRDLLAVTVVQETPTTFFTDFSRNFNSEYASYTITNGEPTAIDAWVKVVFPAGSKVGVGPGYNNEDGLYRIGTLAASNPGNTDVGEAFLYYTAKSNTNVPQPYSLEVWNGKPGEVGSTLLTPTPLSLQYDSVIDTLAAEPNKVSSVLISPSAPSVGEIMTMQVDGYLGNGANRVLFAPATRSDWQPDIFELRNVTNVISGVARTPDRIFYDGLPNTSDQKPFTSVYQFLVTGPITTPTPVDPTQWTQDGKQNWKHHKPDDTPFPPIPPITYELSISKTDGKATYVPGGTTTYTVTIQNTGKAPANNVLIVDTLPPPTQINVPGTVWTVTSLVNATLGSLPAGGTGDTISGTVNLGALTGSVTIQITVPILITASGALTNTVTATAPGDKPISASDTNLDINLSLTKDDGKTTYTPGGTTTYTIVLENTGLAPLNGITLDDTFPAQIDPTSTWTAAYTVGASSGPAPNGLGNGGTGSFVGRTVNLGGLGGTVTITINAKILSSATGQMTNTIFATLATGGPPLSASDTNAPVRDERLTLTKDNGQTTYIPGTTTTYTIKLSNIGLSDVSGITVSDDLPVQLDPLTTTWFATYSNASGTLPTTPTTGDILGTVTTLKGSVGVVTITINGVILSTATGDMVNTVTAKNSVSLSATDTDTPNPTVTLTASKTDGIGTYVPGTSTTYTIEVENIGPSFLNDGVVTDALPPQVASATWTATYSGAGSAGPASGSGPLNETIDLAVGGKAIFLFTVQIKPDATGDLVNTVTFAPPRGTTGNTATATDTNTQSSPQLLLNVTKTDGKTTYLPNQTFPYTIVVSNAGPSTMIDGTVNDPLAAQVASASWTADYSAGSTGPAGGIGGITNAKITLLPGGTATFTLTVTIKSDAFGQMDNTVTLTPPAGASVNPQSVLSATDTNFGPEPPQSVTPGLVVGSDDGCNGPPWVRVLDPDSGEELSRFLAYDARFRGSVRVATGDVTGDGVAEIITAPGRNAIGEVRVFQQALGGWAELTQYRTLAFGPGYRGGVEVAVADIDGDLNNDIVTAMSIRSGMVNVFRVTPGITDPVANAPFKSFRGAPAGTNNGVMISAGDYILGGPAEIAVGTNSGTRALVRVFDVSGTPTVVRSFKPFANNFRGGVTLSTADYDGNGSLDLIVGAGLNGGSRVEVWNPSTGTKIAQTSAFSSLAKPNARVFAVFGSAADGFIGTDSTLYGVQGLNGGRGSKGVWKVLGGNANSLINSQGSLPPLRIAPIALPLG
jgi:uncharacterized repeat protein (TIGR01451 family)